MFLGMLYGLFCDMPTPSKNSISHSTITLALTFQNSRGAKMRLLLQLPLLKMGVPTTFYFLPIATEVIALTVGMEVLVMKMKMDASTIWGDLCLMGTQSIAGEKFKSLVWK
jgi:hypothetical protein